MIFMAGDVASGPSSVMAAMAMGQQAAESVDRFLKDEHLRFGCEYKGPIETEFAIDTSKATKTSRVGMALHKLKGKGDFHDWNRASTETLREKRRNAVYRVGRRLAGTGPVGSACRAKWSARKMPCWSRFPIG